MRTLTVLFSSILALALLSFQGTATPQDTAIPELAKILKPLPVGEIETALHAPIADDQLPTAFTDASIIDQQDATMQAADIGAERSVTWTLAYTPGGASTPEARTTPRATGPEQVYNTASITYLVFEDNLTPEILEGFDEILRSSIGDQAADAEVQDITVAGQPAWFVSVETETNGIPIVMDWIAVPVGKVVVISMTMSGGEAVNTDALLDDTNALSLAAIGHLQASIEERGTPAG